MTEFAVINASPLIFLSRGKHLEMLCHFSKKVIVQDPVAHEIRRKGPDDITVKMLDDVLWIEVTPALPVPQAILEWGLGPGESAVLATAYQRAEFEAIIDDLAARNARLVWEFPCAAHWVLCSPPSNEE